jgi:hypothetical protein
MKVVATRQGVYNQILRDVGEVFSLLTYPDGSWPKARAWVPKLDKNTGKPVGPGEGEWVEIKTKDGKPLHAHFAPDRGAQSATTGPMAGETMDIGWMRSVPDSTPEGFYPEGVDFWSGVMIPQSLKRTIGPQDGRAAQILTHLPQVAEG